MRISPLSGLSSPAIIRSVVDFPQPEGPSRTTKWPVGTANETLLTATHFSPSESLGDTLQGNVIHRLRLCPHYPLTAPLRKPETR